MKTKIFKTLLLLNLMIIAGCSSEDESEIPNSSLAVTANFTANATSIIENESVEFKDRTTGEPKTWNWTFEGGTPATSNEQNPTVTYSSSGTYKVSLTASNANNSDEIVEENYITVEKQKWAVFSYASELFGYSLSIAIDEENTKWISTTGRGLKTYDDNQVVIYNTSNSGLSENELYKVAIDKNGTKWLATATGNIISFDGTTWTTYNPMNSGLPEVNNIQALAVDENNNKWIGTAASGLVKFDGTTWTVFNSSNSGLPEDIIRAVTVGENGTVWIGTATKGFVKFDGTDWTVYDLYPDMRNHISSITIDADGVLWAGTAFGLMKFDGSTWTTLNNRNSGLPPTTFNSIAIDVNGDKWLGTLATGVVKFNGSSGTVFDMNNSPLPSDMIRSIAIDKNGTKWIGTFQGVAAYNENGLDFHD